MDPNAAMEAAAESAKAFTKLQEIFQKMFNPHWTKKQADADAYADERKPILAHFWLDATHKQSDSRCASPYSGWLEQ